MIDRWAETAALGGAADARSSPSGRSARPRSRPASCPASVQELYLARAAGKWSGRTVPAMNLRGWTYHTCRAVFRAANELDAKLFIFEQAVGECDLRRSSLRPNTPQACSRRRSARAIAGPVFLQARP